MRVPKVVKRYKKACEDMAFKGSYHPDQHQEVEEEFNAAQKALVDEIVKLRRRERELVDRISNYF